MTPSSVHSKIGFQVNKGDDRKPEWLGITEWKGT